MNNRSLEIDQVNFDLLKTGRFALIKKDNLHNTIDFLLSPNALNTIDPMSSLFMRYFRGDLITCGQAQLQLEDASLLGFYCSLLEYSNTSPFTLSYIMNENERLQRLFKFNLEKYNTSYCFCSLQVLEKKWAENHAASHSLFEIYLQTFGRDLVINDIVKYPRSFPQLNDYIKSFSNNAEPAFPPVTSVTATTTTQSNIPSVIEESIFITEQEDSKVKSTETEFANNKTRRENLWRANPLFAKSYKGYKLQVPHFNFATTYSNYGIEMNFKEIISNHYLRREFIKDNPRFARLVCQNDDETVKYLRMVYNEVRKYGSNDFEYVTLFLNEIKPSASAINNFFNDIENQILGKAEITEILNKYLATLPILVAPIAPETTDITDEEYNKTIDITDEEYNNLLRVINSYSKDENPGNRESLWYLNPNLVKYCHGFTFRSASGLELKADGLMLRDFFMKSMQLKETRKKFIFDNKYLANAVRQYELDLFLRVVCEQAGIDHDEEFLYLFLDAVKPAPANVEKFLDSISRNIFANKRYVKDILNTYCFELRRQAASSQEKSNQQADAINSSASPILYDVETPHDIAHANTEGEDDEITAFLNGLGASSSEPTHANELTLEIDESAADLDAMTMAPTEVMSTTSTTITPINEPCVEEAIADLNAKLQQVIIQRLNMLAKPPKEQTKDERKAFLDRLKQYDGQFALPLSVEDFAKMYTAINAAFIQLLSIDNIEKMRDFILLFFKRYAIILNTNYSATLAPTLHPSISKNLFMQIEQKLNELSQPIKNLSSANDETTMISLLINRVGFMAHEVVDNDIEPFQLVALIKPPVGAGVNQRRYSAELILAKCEANGFSAFYEVSRLKPTLENEAMQRFYKLDYMLQELFLQKNKISTYSFSSQNELKHLLHLIEENNDNPNNATIMAIPAITLPRKLKRNKKDKKTNSNQGASLSLNQKNKTELVTTKVHKDKHGKKLAVAAPFIKKPAGDQQEEFENPIKVNSLTEYHALMLSKFYQNANRPLRFARKKLPENYIPTKKLPVSMTFANDLNSLFAEIEDSFSNANGKPFKLFTYQRQGILEADAKKRVILCDEMGLGKTIQGVATIKRQLNNNMPKDHVCLLIVPASVLDRWRSDLIKAGITSGDIGILKAEEGIRVNDSLDKVTSKSVLLATYDSLVSRLGLREDNCIKKICGYIPRYPAEFVATNHIDNIDKIYKSINNERNLRKLIGKKYVQNIHKQTEHYFFCRMPTDDELNKLSSLVEISVNDLQSIISWEIIYFYLLENNFINFAGALAVTTKSMDNALTTLYQNRVLTIPQDSILTYFSRRKDLFGIHTILMDEAHHATTNLNFFHLNAISNWMMEKSMMLITGTPLRNGYDELYMLHALLDKDYLAPDVFEKIFNNDIKSVSNAIYALLNNDSEQQRDEYRKNLQKLFDRTKALIERQKMARIRRTCEQTKTENNIPLADPKETTYSISEKQRNYIKNPKRADKIEKMCRNYFPDGEEKQENDVITAQTSDITMKRLEKYFSHPMLKNKEFSPRMFGKTEQEQFQVIDEYIRSHCNNNLDEFIAQSGRLAKTCELLVGVLEKDRNAKIINFSNFIPFAYIIKYVMEKKGYKCGVFNGKLNTIERTQFENDFNIHNKFNIALVSSRAGGEAITLYGEHIILPQDWHIAIREQMLRRAARTGSPFPFIHVLDLFSIDNPLDIKQRSFMRHKKDIEKYFFSHDNVVTIHQLLDIIIDKLLFTASPTFKATIESKRQMLHSLLDMSNQFVLLNHLHLQTTTSTTSNSRFVEILSAHPMPLDSTPKTMTTSKPNARLFSSLGSTADFTDPNKRLSSGLANAETYVDDLEEEEMANSSNWAPRLGASPN